MARTVPRFGHGGGLAGVQIDPCRVERGETRFPSLGLVVREGGQACHAAGLAQPARDGNGFRALAAHLARPMRNDPTANGRPAMGALPIPVETGQPRAAAARCSLGHDGPRLTALAAYLARARAGDGRVAVFLPPGAVAAAARG